MKFKPYFKFVFEILAIVIGITLSFMVDEKREQAQREEANQLMLQGIQTEMKQNHEQLLTVIYWSKKGRVSGEQLLKLYREDTPQVVPDSLFLMLRNFEMNFTFDPLIGILNSGITSGQINYLKNNELKSNLAGFEGLVSDVNESTIEFMEIRDNYYYTKVSSYVSVRDIWKTYYPELDTSKFKPDIKGLFSDRQLESTFTNLNILKRQGLDEQQQLLEVIENILLEIERELK